MNSIQEGNICYLHLIALKVRRGKHRIKAETYQDKIVSKIFTKVRYAQSLDIEF